MVNRTMKFKPIIPKNADPIKLADEIKRGMTTRFLKKYKVHLKSKSRLAQQS